MFAFKFVNHSGTLNGEEENLEDQDDDRGKFHAKEYFIEGKDRNAQILEVIEKSFGWQGFLPQPS